MTRRLFYEDSHLRRFTSRVTGCVQTPRGWEVTLEATAFYPEGGGQPCDLGSLGAANVLDVRERGEDVIHLCDAPVEGTVEGIIHWDRRFDLMQQHTGEHMVSGVVCARYGWHNVGFHMGSEMITIDFDGPIPAEDLPAIEAQVNAFIWQDLQIVTQTPSPEELPQVVYRTKRALPWPVRIVTIPGVDSCACCGVHTKTTGEVGLVKLFSCVKFHQGVRIEMACGGRAMDILNEVYRQNRLVSQAFSAKLLETGEAARQMNQRLAATEYKIVSLERQIFDTIAAGYALHGDVVHFQEGLAPDRVRELADRIATVCGGTAAVFSENENGHIMCLVNKNGDVKDLGNALCKALDGRGGGRPGYFQGSVKAGQAQIRAFFGLI